MAGEYFSNMYNNQQPFSNGYTTQPYGAYDYSSQPSSYEYNLGGGVPIPGGYEYTTVLPASYNYGYSAPQQVSAPTTYNYGYVPDASYYAGPAQLYDSTHSPDESIRLVQRRKSNCMLFFFIIVSHE
jgi:hypothetical protein